MESRSRPVASTRPRRRRRCRPGSRASRLAIAFSATYLLDGLGSLDSDEAQLAFTRPTKPAVLTGKTGSDDAADHRYVLMPVRLAS